MNIQELMKQAQKMQKDMGRIENEINETIYTGTAGGVVKVEIDGSYDVKKVEINEDVMDDRLGLEEMMLIAINDALNQIKKERDERIGALTEGMGLPGGF